MFLTGFKDIAKYHDTITCEIGDFKIFAEIVEDSHTRPVDFTVGDVNRWKNLQWCFCGLIVHVYVFDTLINNRSILYGLELNFTKNNHHLRHFANDLLVEALVFTNKELKILGRLWP